MPRKNETAEELAKRLRAEAAELLRRAGKADKAAARKARDDDTRRKVLVGSWALAQIDNPEFMERMRRELDRLWLIRDDDRRLFGFALLTEEQKAAHPNYEKIRQGGRKREDGGAPLSDGSAPPPSLVQKETEAA